MVAACEVGHIGIEGVHGLLCGGPVLAGKARAVHQGEGGGLVVVPEIWAGLLAGFAGGDAEVLEAVLGSAYGFSIKGLEELERLVCFVACLVVSDLEER